ncbi:O-acyltransferase like protein-like [Belonocnema kinseyi]|uniref:O-acyltransferase like protein-like n=1 Tax=Belonocnema kinseyi TaxID=2817044 RepID=UPI00143DA383|nr:O-acyltransferase like protein-like [Belonocnema kinseyi]
MGILDKEEWALKMVDAASKIPSGILNGNIIDLGMYDECLAIKEKNITEIRGRHCIYNMKIDFNVTKIVLSLSTCIPATCNATDVKHILNLIIFNMTDIGKNGISILSSSCSNIDSPEWTTGSIITFALRILNTKINPGSFPVLNGIRVLSIFWIVMGHTYQQRGSSMLQVNNIELFEWFDSCKSLYVTLAVLAVDSFFTLSGFLMGYLFLKEMSKSRKFNLFDYYLHRYIRLTPAVLVLLLIAKFIVPHLGSGPIWDESLKSQNDCENIWWAILTYIQNYIKPGVMNQCLGHTWYLAVDMQLFLISPIILYPLAKKRNLGLAILGLSFIVSLVIPAAIIAIKKFPATLLGANDNQLGDVFTEYYIVPYARSGPWIVGIFFGFITATKCVHINRVRMILGWCIAMICLIFCICGYESFNEKDYEYDVAWEAIYGSISRPLWAFSLSWIIFASNNGYGGLVGKILSLPIFLPLSRISYCLYLVHMLIQIVITSSAKTAYYFSDFLSFSTFLSDLALSIVVAFFFSLFFESPILILEKMLFRREKRVKTEHPQESGDQKSKA